MGLRGTPLTSSIIYTLVTWLKEGDKNTNFFHRKASNRSRKNKIKKLKLDDGSFTENNGDMKEVVSNFFKSLYKKDA
jgi:hypothetical protein